MFKLRDYQQEFLNDILELIKVNNRIVAQASTGYGKTVVFTELVSVLDSKILVLVDSIDLVNQTKKTFEKKGLDVGVILAGCKVIPKNKVIIGMIKTIWNRREKIPLFDYIIYDECHLWEGNKLFPYFKTAKIIGFTATPVRLKRNKINEFESELETMSDYYDDIVCAKEIDWLMKNNHLVKERNEYIDFNYSNLKTDSTGEFTASSLREVFLSESYLKALRNTFDKLCDGKKTMIFTTSIEANKVYKNLFKDKNVMSFDSKNVDDKRKDIIDWFANTKDGVLLNVNCFTKGFDQCDVEVIIVARATMSLALWIQIAGRGARKTTKIEKPYFLLIDGGNNNQTHGIFSFDRDWKKIFSDKQRKSLLLDIIDCKECGFNFEKKEKICPACGWEIPSPKKEKEPEEKEFVIVGKKAKLLTPTLDLEFHINKGHTKYETLKILKNKWVAFLCKLQLPKNEFLYHEKKGNFAIRFSKYIRPIYFKIIGSMLKEGKAVKWQTYSNKILTETKNKLYEI